LKKIILVRHATAVGHGAERDDFDRSLRKKGRKEALAMVEWYRRIAETPDLLLSSPANRAIETARIFAKEFGYPKKRILQDEALYGGLDPSNFLAILKTLDDKHESVMVFGHDPSFSDFAQYIAKGFDHYLPKCSIYGVTTRRRSWKTIRRGDGHVEIFEHPDGLRQRRELAAAVRDEMTGRIERGIIDALGEFGVKDDVEGDEKIRRASTKLAKTFAPRAALQAHPKTVKRRARKRKGKQ
jgi:phosphohistidine phosphatase